MYYLSIYFGQTLHNCRSETFYMMTRPKTFINNKITHSERLNWQLAVIALHNRFNGAYKVTMKSTKGRRLPDIIWQKHQNFIVMGEAAHDPNLSQWIIYFQNSRFSVARNQGYEYFNSLVGLVVVSLNFGVDLIWTWELKMLSMAGRNIVLCNEDCGSCISHGPLCFKTQKCLLLLYLVQCLICSSKMHLKSLINI